MNKHAFWEVGHSLSQFVYNSDESVGKLAEALPPVQRTHVLLASVIHELSVIRSYHYIQVVIQREIRDTVLEVTKQLRDRPRDPIADGLRAFYEGRNPGRATPLDDTILAPLDDRTRRVIYRAMNDGNVVIADDLAQFGARRIGRIRDCGSVTLNKIRTWFLATFGFPLED